jgi:hypothetical protein
LKQLDSTTIAAAGSVAGNDAEKKMQHSFGSLGWFK